MLISFGSSSIMFIRIRIRFVIIIMWYLFGMLSTSSQMYKRHFRFDIFRSPPLFLSPSIPPSLIAYFSKVSRSFQSSCRNYCGYVLIPRIFHKLPCPLPSYFTNIYLLHPIWIALFFNFHFNEDLLDINIIQKLLAYTYVCIYSSLLLFD